jgi:hypothetical protein
MVDIPEYVMPKHLESLNILIKEKGIAILEKSHKKLQELLSNIGPGLLFDRTDNMLLKKGDGIIYVNKRWLISHSILLNLIRS